jgi:hypothetical protein
VTSLAVAKKAPPNNEMQRTKHGSRWSFAAELSVGR